MAWQTVGRDYICTEIAQINWESGTAHMHINNNTIIVILHSIICIIKVSSVSIYIRYTGEKRTKKLTEEQKKE